MPTDKAETRLSISKHVLSLFSNSVVQLPFVLVGRSMIQRLNGPFTRCILREVRRQPNA